MLPAVAFKIYRDFFAILSVVLYMIASEGVFCDRLRCERPDYIANGSYRLKRNFMRVICNNGYQLQGLKTIGCVRGKWDGEKPVCAKKGCPKNLETPENGRIQIEGDLKAILYCSDNYSLAGNRHVYCNGTHWDRPIGTCRERTGIVSHECDFETDDICGWSYEPMANLEWKRVMAANVFTSFKTGPRYDHTTRTHNGGHYMLMESLVRQYMPVTLTSPIYDRELSLKTACCFQFHYFMYGAGIGDLLVVVKPVSITLDEILLSRTDSSSFIKFERNGNQNNIWNEAHFTIEELDEDFQIVFVAKSGRSQLSDIAVDDVRLLTGEDCKALDRNADETISNEEFDTTTYQSLYDIQSCVGRCYNATNFGIVRNGGHLMGLCSCEADCEDADTCCPDFKSACVNELFESSTIDSVTYSDDVASDVKTSASTTTMPTTLSTTTFKTTPTTMKTVPTTRRTTSTTTAKPTTTTTAKTTTATIRTTPTTTTTKATTTPKTSTTTTTPRTTTTTTTPRTTTTTTTRRTTRATTTTTRKPTTTTTVRTTKATTTTTTTKRPTTTTLKTTTTTAETTTASQRTTRPTESTTLDFSRNSRVKTPTQKPSTRSKTTSYVIDSDPKVEAAHRGSSLLMGTLIFIVILVLVGVAYRRFGDHAVAWYMIHFSKQSGQCEETSSITTSFKRPPSKPQRGERGTRAMYRKKSAYANDSKQLLIEDDDDDDDNAPVNGNIALKSSIYTEL